MPQFNIRDYARKRYMQNGKYAVVKIDLSAYEILREYCTKENIPMVAAATAAIEFAFQNESNGKDE